MKLTKLEAEILEHRLSAGDCIADCYDFDLSGYTLDELLASGELFWDRSDLETCIDALYRSILPMLKSGGDWDFREAARDYPPTMIEEILRNCIEASTWTAGSAANAEQHDNYDMIVGKSIAAGNRLARKLAAEFGWQRDETPSFPTS